jgi:hypothetical protein
MPRPINRPAGGVKSWPGCLPGITKVLSERRMDDSGLTAALDRAEQALQRIERAFANRQPSSGRDQELRAKVREVVEELDVLIREAAA